MIKRQMLPNISDTFIHNEYPHTQMLNKNFFVIPWIKYLLLLVDFHGFIDTVYVGEKICLKQYFYMSQISDIPIGKFLQGHNFPIMPDFLG